MGFNCFIAFSLIYRRVTQPRDAGVAVPIAAAGWRQQPAVDPSVTIKFCERWRNIPPTFNWDDSRFVLVFLWFFLHHVTHDSLVKDESESLRLTPCFSLRSFKMHRKYKTKSKLAAHGPQTHWAKAAAGPHEGILRSLRTLLRSALVPGEDG